MRCGRCTRPSSSSGRNRPSWPAPKNSAAGPPIRLPPAFRDPRQSRRIGLAAIAAALILVAVVIPELAFDLPASASSFEGPTRTAKVLQVIDLGAQDTARGRVYNQRVELLMDGQRVSVERSLLAEEERLPLAPGDRVLVSAVPGPQGTSYFIVDYARLDKLWLLAGAFIVAVLAVARLQGAWSLLGLLASLIVIIRFIIPGILAGYSPLLIAFCGALVIMATTLYLSHGINWKSSIALAGTGLSLVLTLVLADFGIDFARLTGLVTEEATTLSLLTQGDIDPTGLLLGGIIIGALGVLDDVTVAQASAVFEIGRANPSLSRAQLWLRGMNVGRDHIASTVNTLFLAYAGSALPLLLVLSTQAEPLTTALSQEVVATEIVRSLIGGLGIVSAVPVTTALAAYVASRLGAQQTPPTAAGDDVYHGLHRHGHGE